MRITAEIISDNGSCAGIIENVSEQGLYMETVPDDLLSNSAKFSPDAILEVKFSQGNNGEMFHLRCKVIWSYMPGPDAMVCKTGLEVVFPPPAYIEFYRALQ